MRKQKLSGMLQFNVIDIVQNRRPDIVVIEKSKQECKFIDIAVPNDDRFGSKEQGKIEKYQDLRQEIAHLRGMKKVQVIPIVIGALGMISQKLEMRLGKIGVNIQRHCKRVDSLDLLGYQEEL